MTYGQFSINLVRHILRMFSNSEQILIFLEIANFNSMYNLRLLVVYPGHLQQRKADHVLEGTDAVSSEGEHVK